MKCLNCQKEVSEKAKYCSDKCRMAYVRRTKQGEQPEQNDPIMQPEQPTRTTATATDALFEAWRPNYYIFEEPEQKKVCVYCGKDFSTMLKLLRFCSPDCQKQVMVMIATGGKPKDLQKA